MLGDHDHIKQLADKYKIRIIHDAAHSFGSKYNGKIIGSFSDICMFSFDPVKTITCIDGGEAVIAYAGTNKGVFRKIKGKEDWEEINMGLPLKNRDVHSMHLREPSSGDCILCIEFEDVIFKKIKNSNRWELFKGKDVETCLSP